MYLFLTLTFFGAQAIIPGDFVSQFSQFLPDAELRALREQLGLDQPLWVQYLSWLRTVASGEFGFSYWGTPVGEILWELLPATLLVLVSGTLLAFAAGHWLGKLSAWRGSGLFTGATSFAAVLFYTTFPPWLAFVMLYLVARLIGGNPDQALYVFSGGRAQFLEPPRGRPDPTLIIMVATLILVPVLLWIASYLWKRWSGRRLPLLIGTPLLLALVGLGWYAGGLWPTAVVYLRFASVPILTYALLTFGEVMLITRTSMSDILSEDFITTARAKGLPARLVRDQHASRNAILPVLSRLVISLPYLLTGLVIIEDALRWRGLSSALFTSLYTQDMPVVMAALVLVAIFSIIARIMVDIAHLLLDPRIRHRSSELDPSQ